MNRLFGLKRWGAAALTGLLWAGGGQAQGQTQIGLRAVPNVTTVAAGGAFSLSIFLDVMQLAEGDNFTAVASYFTYAQDAAGGDAPVSPFQSVVATYFPGAGAGLSGFPNQTNSNVAQRVTRTGVADYLGWTFRYNNGTNEPRTDTGSFLLGTAEFTLQSALEEGTVIDMAFLDVSGLGRTFVTGKFQGNNPEGSMTPNTTPVTLGVNSVRITVGAAEVPGPSAVLVMAMGGVGMLGALRLRCRAKSV